MNQQEMNRNLMAEIAIRCEGLTRYYGEVHAVEDLNLEVPTGSVFGFIGRNGAGKTTTIRMLTGLAHPTRGRAWVAGIETTTADSAARRTFGYLPQSPAFYNWMTPIEYLDFCARLFGLTLEETKTRSAEVLALVGLEKAARRRIGGFSGGMLQRMGIAQALVHRPPVLFLDEPTSSLDPAGRYEVLDLIGRLRGEATVFLSSHILADVERVCDHVAIIREGRLVLVSSSEELLQRYAPSAAVFVFSNLTDENNEAKQAFFQAVEAQPWCLSVSQEGQSVRIVVQDKTTARYALLPLIVEHGLVLERYEWARPSLEEIFLQVSA